MKIADNILLMSDVCVYIIYMDNTTTFNRENKMPWNEYKEMEKIRNAPCMGKNMFQSASCPAYRIGCQACDKCDLVEYYKAEHENFERSYPSMITGM